MWFNKLSCQQGRSFSLEISPPEISPRIISANILGKYLQDISCYVNTWANLGSWAPLGSQQTNSQKSTPPGEIWRDMEHKRLGLRGPLCGKLKPQKSEGNLQIAYTLQGKLAIRHIQAKKDCRKTSTKHGWYTILHHFQTKDALLNSRWLW